VGIQINWALALLAFVCEYVDSTLGMGYGTILTPLLLLLGFRTTQTVPSVLLSEFVTGILAGFMHHRVGNVRFVRGSRALNVAIVLAACSIVGTLAAVYVMIPRQSLGPHSSFVITARSTAPGYGPGVWRLNRSI
jgi:uncharacterized protein